MLKNQRFKHELMAFKNQDKKFTMYETLLPTPTNPRLPTPIQKRRGTVLSKLGHSDIDDIITKKLLSPIKLSKERNGTPTEQRKPSVSFSRRVNDHYYFNINKEKKP